MAHSVTFAGHWYLAAAFAAGLPGWCAQTIEVRADGGMLRASAPQVHFLAGNPLERLHNGASVIFAVQITLLANRRTDVLRRAASRFAVSYDLWEEKFAVTRLGKPRHSVSHLSAREAEAWCLDELRVPVSGLPPDSPFWVRLEVRAEEVSDESLSEEESGFTLARLVELFSRSPAREQPHWEEEVGPLRLRDLR